MGLLKHEPKPTKPPTYWLERAVDDWAKLFPFRRQFGAWLPEELIRVDEFHEDGTLVIKAELPGIDPDKDIGLTVSNGLLHIEAERRDEERTEEKGYVRRELRYGSFTRTLPLPDGLSEDDVKATYKDGILEIRIPAPEPRPGMKVPITKS
jgi:HSP20 family protein